MADTPFNNSMYEREGDRRQKARAIESFARHVNKTADCWIWTSCCHIRDGGPLFSFRGKTVRARRWIHEQLIGSIPEGFEVASSCGNRKCVKPEHLEAKSPGQKSA